VKTKLNNECRIKGLTFFVTAHQTNFRPFNKSNIFLRSSFQFFIVSALLIGLVAAQSEDEVPPGRTRICKEGEFPGKRNKRQAPDAPGPDAPKPCWFIPDSSIASGDDCEKRFTETNTCEKSQVFVPLGVVSST
jgi:hypothetical protein